MHTDSLADMNWHMSSLSLVDLKLLNPLPIIHKMPTNAFKINKQILYYLMVYALLHVSPYVSYLQGKSSIMEKRRIPTQT
jgi:hypothetical protein